MTQEIGYIQPRNPDDKIDMDKCPYGSIIFILPYHSCATAAMYPVSLQK